MTTNDPKALLVSARIRMMERHPWYGILLMRLQTEFTDTIPTAATDGQRLYINPTTFAELSPDERVGVLAHEVLHCVLSHPLRQHGHRPTRWNAAADYVVNLMVRSSGLCLPEGVLIDSRYDGMSAEQVYDAMPDDPQDGSWDVGGCLDAPDDADPHAMRAAWEQAASSAYASVKSCGSVPSSLVLTINGLIHPEVDWRDVLRDVVARATRSDYTWTRPNRRYHGRVILPGLHGLETDDVIVCVDTSGSMSAQDLSLAAGAIDEIMEYMPACIQVVYSDAEVSSSQEFQPGEPLALKPTGGGGTSLDPALQWAADYDRPVAAIIYVTDGHAPDPTVDPGADTVWLVTRHGNPNFRPPVGRVIRMTS